ncbi:hypothetical protein D5F01_LYC02204 [Larimichthys crocea]|uniref:Uncharacterized protein n=1 Tax=Larimichthys crocea TaxID=215358 RepID=A0A6G0J8J2_LARCR|nr:hypothetical protein D5F01_LYC02204 [Larimichthys crocea]
MVSRKDGLYTPAIAQELPVNLEANAEVVWNWLNAEQRMMATVTEYPNGIYYSVYTKMWKYPGGARVSTAHLTDGRFMAIGPQLPPLRTANENNGIPTKPLTQEVETQTEWLDTKEQANARVTAILTQLDLSDKASPTAVPPLEEPEMPCMDKLLILDQWDKTPEPSHFTTSVDQDVLLLQDDGEEDDFLFSKT